ncbi:MAG: hypothetical protein ACR2GC_10550 [Methyloceanibacter sp.]|uniref:hypothetical protein n=1 Tax=Methyloceanibacter sp. TaxID=1965321 RepID=UPI003D9B4F5B
MSDKIECMAMGSTKRRVAALREKRVDRGATPAEAEAAKAKADQLDKTDKAVEILKSYRFSEEQAKGIVEALDELPPYREGRWRWGLMFDYCSSHQHLDPHSLEGQLRWLNQELNGTFSQSIGGPLREAKTADAAANIFKPYAERL